jgi:hypothetical protein
MFRPVQFSLTWQRHGFDETVAPGLRVRSCVALLQFWHINQKPEHLRILLEHPADPEKQFLGFLHHPAEFRKIVEADRLRLGRA